MSKEKPKLNTRAILALMAMHDGKAPPADGRGELMMQKLCCYNEGWKLTKRGKDIARHLTGRL